MKKKYLYHATFMECLESIRENGLGGVKEKNWKISKEGVVCFSSSAARAEHYALLAKDQNPKRWRSIITVLAVRADLLREEDMEKDGCDPLTVEYRGVVPPSRLYVFHFTDGRHERLRRPEAEARKKRA